MTRVTTGPEALSGNLSTAVLVLRLGAAINSIRAVQRWTLQKSRAEGRVGDLDRFQAYIVAAAYFTEACKLFWRNRKLVLDLAQKGSADDKNVESLLLIADPEAKIQKDLLKWIRDREAFHWDCDVFERWADAQKSEIVWLQAEGDTRAGEVVWASYEAVCEFTAGLPHGSSQPDLRERIKEQVGAVADSAEVVCSVFECAVEGFLKLNGAVWKAA